MRRNNCSEQAESSSLKCLVQDSFCCLQLYIFINILHFYFTLPWFWSWVQAKSAKLQISYSSCCVIHDKPDKGEETVAASCQRKQDNTRKARSRWPISTLSVVAKIQMKSSVIAVGTLEKRRGVQNQPLCMHVRFIQPGTEATNKEPTS